ncbi:helix-turn-helix domain-containing protein [Mobiluncus mulieris]|nr:helix-turn-helix domain-containing protein [Mobiluncus mulieris]
MTPIQDTPTRPQTLQPPDSIERMLDFSRFLDNAGSQAMLLGPDGQQESIPLEVFQVLQMVTQAMSRHQAITVTPVDQRLTTQEAADFLGMSRPTLIKLLEKREIPYEKLPGSRHRRVLLKDLLAYQENLRARREALFQTMVEDAEDDGLYDLNEPLPKSYYKE